MPKRKLISVAVWFMTFLYFGDRSLAQSDSIATADENRMFEKVEIEASFAGGQAAWVKFLEKNLNAEVPVKKKAPAGRYTVVIQFVVDREGKISDITALTDHGYGMEEEVIRILRRSPGWQPATQGGRTVKAFRRQPVTFQIDEEKKKKKNKDD
jgi:protein TonB